METVTVEAEQERQDEALQPSYYTPRTSFHNGSAVGNMPTNGGNPPNGAAPVKYSTSAVPAEFSKKRRAAVLITAWLSQFAIYSNMFMFGILYVVLLAEFKAGKGVTAWIGSLAFGIMLLSSRFVSMLCERWGAAVVLMSGAVICPMSLIFSSLVTGSVYWLFLTYGLGLGVGTAFLNHPVIIYCGRYFPEHQRSRVLSTILTGSLVGIMALSPSYERVIELWGWRRALWWLAAVQAICSFGCGLAFCPVQPSRQAVQKRNKRRLSEAPVRLQAHTSDLQSTEECDDNRIAQSSGRSISRSVGTVFHNFILHRQLWRNSRFLIYLVAGTLWIACYSTPFVHLKNMVETDKNISSSDGALLLTYSAGGGLVMLPIFGWLADALKSTRNRLHLYSAIAFAIGLANILVHFGTAYWHFVVYAVVMGLGRSGVMLLAIVTQDLTSVHLYGPAWASVCLFGGIPDLIGPPIAGWITDATGSYRLAYILAGSICMSSLIGFEWVACILATEPMATSVTCKHGKDRKQSEAQLRCNDDDDAFLY